MAARQAIASKRHLRVDMKISKKVWLTPKLEQVEMVDTQNCRFTMNMEKLFSGAEFLMCIRGSGS
jgi:hypothetical protein